MSQWCEKKEGGKLTSIKILYEPCKLFLLLVLRYRLGVDLPLFD